MTGGMDRRRRRRERLRRGREFLVLATVAGAVGWVVASLVGGPGDPTSVPSAWDPVSVLTYATGIVGAIAALVALFLAYVDRGD